MNEAPLDIKKTPLERAMFGFGVEVESNPARFFNPEFIKGIIGQEQVAGRFVGRAFLSLIILNSISVGYVEGVTFKFQLFGIQLSAFPGTTVALCLFLGGAIFAFASRVLDQLMITRMRWIVLHRLVGTDLVNMATAHLKGDTVWADLLTPRFIGYASTRAHKSLGIFHTAAIAIFLGSILLASFYSLVSLFRFNMSAPTSSLWSITLSGAGLLIGALGVITAIVCVFIPFKFVRPELDPAQPEQQVTDALVQSVANP